MKLRWHKTPQKKSFVCEAGARNILAPFTCLKVGLEKIQKSFIKPDLIKSEKIRLLFLHLGDSSSSRCSRTLPLCSQAAFTTNQTLALTAAASQSTAACGDRNMKAGETLRQIVRCGVNATFRAQEGRQEVALHALCSNKQIRFFSLRMI